MQYDDAPNIVFTSRFLVGASSLDLDIPFRSMVAITFIDLKPITRFPTILGG